MALAPSDQLARNWVVLALHDLRMAIAACQEAGHPYALVVAPLVASAGAVERLVPLVEAGTEETCHG